MAGTIPFQPSDNNYRLAVPIDSALYLFDVHWNSRDSAWYFDLYDSNEDAIATGLKVVLGANIGGRNAAPFFQTYILRAFDTSGQSLDAGYDDLGDRIVVQVTAFADLGITKT